MTLSPKTNAIIYFAMGIFFMFIAVGVPGDTFNTTTIILAIIATLDFGVGIRFLRLHLQLKKENGKQ
ncbi:MAG TPA: DUF4305 domain-containing protein [Bacillota bacterium]|nr:DUF4305 domain-containing protein [Bacillota bacterium]